MTPGYIGDVTTELGSGARPSACFILHGMRDFHAAARYVRSLPYGRNSDLSDYGLVLPERRGTCTTKHALLAALAREHDRPVELRLGICEMNGDNTPGVGPVLHRYGLDGVPEAHCYLAYRGLRVDLTRPEPVEDFLDEETGAYKIDTHRRFVREWALRRDLDFERVWRIREECIDAHSKQHIKRKGTAR